MSKNSEGVKARPQTGMTGPGKIMKRNRVVLEGS